MQDPITEIHSPKLIRGQDRDRKMVRPELALKLEEESVAEFCDRLETQA